ncbi:MAG: diacylglycerol/lipid kinase family protein [Solirubrobacteraceae bacterium]
MPFPEAPALERLADVAALERPAVAKRMLVIVNPYATTMSDRLKHLVVYALQGRYDVTAVDTQRKGHAIELVAAAARESYDVVVAFGGDGTVNEAANGLAGATTPLTCLPGGSNNVFCKMLGIPNDVVDATEHLLGLPDHWKPRAVDLGRANGRAFTFAAGMGLDASVVERVDQHPHMKRRFGAWYFTEKAVGTFLRRYVVRAPRLSVAVDGAPAFAGVSVFFQNGQPYTYFKSRPINLTEGARLNSGDLAGVVLTRASPVDVPTILYRALSSAAMPSHRRVEAFDRAHDVVIRSADGRPVPWQVDGDHVADEDEVRVTVEPSALRVVA